MDPVGFQHSDGPQWRISEQGPGKALKLKVQVPQRAGVLPYPATGGVCGSRHKMLMQSVWEKHQNPWAPFLAHAAAPLLLYQRQVSSLKLKPKAARYMILHTNNGALGKDRRIKRLSAN